MYRTVARLLVLACLLLPAGDAFAQQRAGQVFEAIRNLAGTQRATLAPSDIDRRLRDLDDASPIDVTYPVTGVRTYDRFFQDIAKIQGTLALLELAVESSNRLVDDTLVSEVFSGDILVDAFGRVLEVPAEHQQEMLVALATGDSRAAGQLVRNLSTIQFRQVRENFLASYGDLGALMDVMPVLVSELESLPRDIARLAQDAPDLATEAPSAFSGSNAALAPRVAAALVEAGRDLAELPNQVASIGQSLRDVGMVGR